MSAFILPVRVYYEDTDAGGIVYYANYLKFCERARSQWLSSLGVRQQELLARGEGFVVCELKVRYRAPARLEDELEVSCEVCAAGRASIMCEQQVCLRNGAENRVLCELECRLAYVALHSGRPRPMPGDLIEKIKNQLPPPRPTE